MFLNSDHGKVTLYELRIYKRLEDVKMKIISESPYEKIIKKECLPIDNYAYYNYPELDEPYYIIRGGSKLIERKERNDFYGTVVEIYESTFLKYTLPDIYFVLQRLEDQDYSYLAKLNQYICGSFQNSSCDIFEKHRKAILNNIRLVEVLSIEKEYFLDFYLQLCKKSKGNLHTSLENTKQYVYEMDVSSVPKLIKK